MSKVITVATNKGGPGKTSIATHLAWCGAEQNLNSLLLDFDPQGNATQNFINPLKLPKDGLNAVELFNEKVEKKPVVIEKNLSLIPADERLVAVERLDMKAAKKLKLEIQKLADTYDLIVIDTPPTLGFAMLAPMVASDYVVSPVIPDAYGVGGVRNVNNKVKDIRQSLNKKLQILSIIINLFDRRNTAHINTVKMLKERLGNIVVPIEIGRHSSISNTVFRQKPVWREPSSGSQREVGKIVKTAMLSILQQAELI